LKIPLTKYPNRVNTVRPRSQLQINKLLCKKERVPTVLEMDQLMIKKQMMNSFN
jgi:hypothetical protein